MIFAIDPGNVYSGWCVLDIAAYKPVAFGKDENAAVLHALQAWAEETDIVVIERLQNFGMSVGRTVLETCEWVGRFTQAAETAGLPVDYVYRTEEKVNICHSSRANDTTIRQALADRFAYGTPNNGKGTKSAPGWFYGFRADIWQAYAVGVTFLDRYKREEDTEQWTE